MDRNTIIMYTPVIHRGYVDFIKKYDPCEVFVLGEDCIAECDYLRKEIRALSPHEAIRAINSLSIAHKVDIITKEGLEILNNKSSNIILSDEDVSRIIAEKFLSSCTIKYENIFLRWNRENTTNKEDVKYDREIEMNEFMFLACKIGERSSDWWRQVGAVLVLENGECLEACNKHMPTEHTPYIDGDPRNTLKKGYGIELCSAIHAEANVIAKAAKIGIKTNNGSIFVSTFPCPVCSRLIIKSGIKKVFFHEGYAMLNGYEILHNHGIEIIHVK